MTLLKDIVQIEKGRKYNLLEENQEGAIRVFQANDFRNENKPLYTFDEGGVFADEDDIMLVWDGSVGQMGFGRCGYVGSTMVKLKVKNKKQFSPFFIYRFLQTKSEYLKRKATGATIMHINRKSLEQLEIPDLDLPDQLHIANLLSKAENLINQRRESIRLLDEFLKSTFLEMFGDPVVNAKGFSISKITEQCDVKGGKRIPKGSKLVKENTGYPYIKAGNIKNGIITLKELEYLTPELREQLKRYTVEKGDVCITVVGVNIGDVGIVPDELHLANLTENANKLLIKNKSILNNIYLAHYLMSDFVQSDFVNSIKATGVPKLALYRIENTRLLLPPIELQARFAQIVKKREALKAQYRESLQELENLYGSLSQRAFKGELQSNEDGLLMTAELNMKYRK